MRSTKALEHPDQLISIVRRRYHEIEQSGAIAVSPATVADAAYKDIEDHKKPSELVKLSSINYLRQLARSVCRERYVEDQTAVESQNLSLFDFKLQPRYPATREDETVYVLREYLTREERQRNIGRLRHEASAKTVHADALQAETDYLDSVGKLPETVEVAEVCEQ